MRNIKSWQNHLPAYLSLIITGLGIGWLVGLAVSPVVSIVVTSVTGSAAAIIATMSGLEKKQDEPEEVGHRQTPAIQWNVTPYPIAMLIIGLMIGSTFGLVARTHDWLGSDLATDRARWTSAGLDDKVVVQRLFDAAYPATPGKESVAASAQGGYLFAAVTSSECGRLLGVPDNRLATEMGSSTNKLVKSFSEVIQDPSILRKVVNILCAPS